MYIICTETGRSPKNKTKCSFGFLKHCTETFQSIENCCHVNRAKINNIIIGFAFKGPYRCFIPFTAHHNYIIVLCGFNIQMRFRSFLSSRTTN